MPLVCVETGYIENINDISHATTDLVFAAITEALSKLARGPGDCKNLVKSVTVTGRHFSNGPSRDDDIHLKVDVIFVEQKTSGREEVTFPDRGFTFTTKTSSLPKDLTAKFIDNVKEHIEERMEQFDSRNERYKKISAHIDRIQTDATSEKPR